MSNFTFLTEFLGKAIGNTKKLGTKAAIIDFAILLVGDGLDNYSVTGSRKYRTSS